MAYTVEWLMDQVLSCVSTPSAWRLSASGSVEADAGLSKIVFVGTQGGMLYMGMGAGNSTFAYPYFGVGGGAGLAVSALGPVAASFSLPSFTSTGGEFGRLYIPPAIFGSTDVTEDTLTGPLILMGPSAALGAGVYFSVILFGARVSGPIAPYDLWMTTKAVAFQAGFNATTSAGISVSGFQLVVGPRVR
jgi:hypothetical protein